MKKWFVGFLFFCAGNLVVLPASASCKNQSGVNTIASLMAKRASYMKKVALIKYRQNHDASPYDSAQEIHVLASAKKLANKYGLPLDALTSFIQIQMDLSKQIQAQWLKAWREDKDSAPRKGSSLEFLRTEIEKASDALYKSIARMDNDLSTCTVHELSEVLAHHFNRLDIGESSYMSLYEPMLAHSLKVLSQQKKPDYFKEQPAQSKSQQAGIHSGRDQT